MYARRIFIAIAIFAMLATSAFSQNKIWTVDSNPGNPGADFSSLQEAHDESGVLAGDTLYLAGTSVSYGNLFMTKKLIIIGPGYFLTENLDNQANPASAKTGFLDLNAGSEGSVFIGLEIASTIDIDVSSLTFRRNLIREFANGADLINIGTGDFSNIVFVQNYIINTGTSSQSECFEITNNSVNIIIINNFIATSHTDPNGSEAISSGTGNTSLQVINNVIRGEVDIGDIAIFDNNILREGDFTGTLVSPNNNIGNSTQFDTTSENQQNVDMTTVFELTGSTDGQWQLKSGSPAIGAGLTGEDIGMYGGLSSYVLSGIPPIPSVYFFSSPVQGTNTQGLPVQMKAKSNN